MAGVPLTVDDPLLHVVAASNSSADIDIQPVSPASFDLDNMVTVAALDHNDNYAGFSNFGATNVDLAAPGVDVLSTFPAGTCSLCDPTGYGLLSGTSMAAPHVTGVAAISFSRLPTLNTRQVRSQLLASVDPIPSTATPTFTNGRVNTANALTDLTTLRHPHR